MRSAGQRDGSGPLRGLLTALALLLLVTAGSSSLSAQALVGGRVVHPDLKPVPSVRVVLHRVGRDAQGPLDSTATARDGRFRFRFTPDTSAIYLLSARYAGVEYFSPPVQLDSVGRDTAISVVVYDTSSTAPIELAARHIVIPRAGDDGTREVLDLVVLQNQGTVARVAPDTLGASWSAPLPPGSEGLDVGQGDVSPDAIVRRNDSIFMAAPIGPGEKELSFQYHLPRARDRVQIPFGREGGTVNVLLEEPGAVASAPGLAFADTQMIGGRSFRRFTGAIPAGGVVSVRLPGPPRAPVAVLAALVGASVIALGLAGWHLFRRGGAPERQPGSSPQDALLDRLAALDARYIGREDKVEANEWATYQADRTRLKEELQAMLAAQGQAR
ncbi:MAG: carboxypeptidase-like regulatory domain-containing protein [Gemmatimonadales bacterium]